jgi:hypothetical protein
MVQSESLETSFLIVVELRWTEFAIHIIAQTSDKHLDGFWTNGSAMHTAQGVGKVNEMYME